MKILFFLLLTFPLFSQLSITNNCSYLVIDYETQNGGALLLVDDRIEEVVSVLDSGVYLSYSVDEVILVDSSNNIIDWVTIPDECPVFYSVISDVIFFNIDIGTVTVRKNLGSRWERKFRIRPKSGDSRWLGVGTFLIEWTDGNNQMFDIVRLY